MNMKRIKLMVLTAGLFLVSTTLHAVDMDDLDVTIRVIESDSAEMDEMTHEIKLPEMSDVDSSLENEHEDEPKAEHEPEHEDGTEENHEDSVEEHHDEAEERHFCCRN